MDIENFRSLLSALIAALPTVMSLGIIAILAFPTSKTGLKNENYFKIFTSFLIPIIGLFNVAIFFNILALTSLDAQGCNPYLSLSIGLSIASFIIMSWYLFAYVLIIPKIWK